MVSGWATDSRVLYTMLVALVAAERLVELLVSRRNLARARSRGGVVESRRSYLTVAVFHAALLLACPVEVWALDRQWWPPLGVPMLGVLAATMGLRYWVIATLGESWNVRVVVVPGDPPVTRGPFRYVRHPNYLAVALEVPALALVHGAWLVGAGFGLANLLVLAPGTLPRTSSGKLRRQEALRLHLSGALQPPRKVTATLLAGAVARSVLAYLDLRLRRETSSDA